jgi:hypothetical protein
MPHVHLSHFCWPPVPVTVPVPPPFVASDASYAAACLARSAVMDRITLTPQYPKKLEPRFIGPF